VELIDKYHQFGIIDSCNFRIPLHSDKIRLIHLCKIKTEIDRATAEEIRNSGYLKNLAVSWNSDNATVYGSFAKYYFGNNLNLLTLNQYKIVTSDLSEKLGIDISLAKIFQLDNAFDAEVALPVKSYFNLFGEKKGMMRTPTDRNSLYYSNSFKIVNIYDKLKDLKHDGMIVTGIENLMRENLMRFEVRNKTAAIAKIIKMFGLTELTIADLRRRDIFSEFVRAVLKEYQSIAKKQDFYFDGNIRKPNDIITPLAIAGINSIGLENVYSMIENTRALKKLKHNEYYSRMKNKVRGLSKHKDYTRPYPALTDLDNEMKLIENLSLRWVF